MLNANDLIDFVDEYLISETIDQYEHGWGYAYGPYYCTICKGQGNNTEPDSITHEADCPVAKWKRLKVHFPKPTVIDLTVDLTYGTDFIFPMGDIQPTVCCGEVFVSSTALEAHRKAEHGDQPAQ